MLAPRLIVINLLWHLIVFSHTFHTIFFDCASLSVAIGYKTKLWSSHNCLMSLPNFLQCATHNSENEAGVFEILFKASCKQYKNRLVTRQSLKQISTESKISDGGITIATSSGNASSVATLWVCYILHCGLLVCLCSLVLLWRAKTMLMYLL